MQRISLVLAFAALGLAGWFTMPDEPAEALANSQTFCITGTSDGGGWSYHYRLIPGPGFVGGGNSGIPVDDDATDFATAFKNDIDGSFGFTATANGNCFTVKAPGNSNFSFEVGPANAMAGCNVTTRANGCSFNPCVIQSPPFPSECSVGGVAELPDASLIAPLTASDASGSGAGAFVYLASAAGVTGLVAVGGAAWYVRRRRTRAAP